MNTSLAIFRMPSERVVLNVVAHSRRQDVSPRRQRAEVRGARGETNPERSGVAEEVSFLKAPLGAVCMNSKITYEGESPCITTAERAPPLVTQVEGAWGHPTRKTMK